MRLWTDGLDGGFIRYCNKTTASTDLYSILRATFLSLSGPVIQFLYNSMKFDWEIGASGNTTRSDPILGKNSFADIFFFDKNVSCVSDNFQAGPRENHTKTNSRNIQEKFKYSRNISCRNILLRGAIFIGLQKMFESQTT